MYYLRKEPYKTTLNGKTYWTEDRAIYKHRKFARFYRMDFLGIGRNPTGFKLYTCKTLKRIKELQKAVFEYCGELFDIYDENGKVKE